MDRGIVYTGQIPLEIDFLYPQRAAMIGIGKLAEAVLGNQPVIDGLLVQPTTPNSMAVTVRAGQLYTSAALDATNYGTMSADIVHQVVKQGIMMDAINVPLSAPATSGFQQYFLIQANFQERDEGAVVLPYYNAANPSVAWSGPGNSGEQQYKQRVGAIIVQVKAGTPAPGGGAVAPNPDPGWTGLAWVLTSNGQSTIGSSQITPYPTTSRLTVKLPQLARSAGIAVTTVSASTNLTPDQAGLVVVDMTSFNNEITIRLPPAANSGFSQRFTFVAYRPTPPVGLVTSASARIVPSGTDFIPENGVSMFAMDHVTLYSDGVSRWHVASRVPQNGFKVQAVNTNQTMTSGVQGSVVFNQVVQPSPMQWWNSATPDRILVPYSSVRCKVSACLHFSSGSTVGNRQIGVEIGTTGTTLGTFDAVTRVSASNSLDTILNVSGSVLHLNRGTAIRLLFWQDSGFSLGLVQAWMQIEVLQ